MGQRDEEKNEWLQPHHTPSSWSASRGWTCIIQSWLHITPLQSVHWGCSNICLSSSDVGFYSLTPAQCWSQSSRLDETAKPQLFHVQQGPWLICVSFVHSFFNLKRKIKKKRKNHGIWVLVICFSFRFFFLSFFTWAQNRKSANKPFFFCFVCFVLKKEIEKQVQFKHCIILLQPCRLI